MVKLRLRSIPLGLFALVAFTLLGIAAASSPSPKESASSPSPSPSPSEEVELICHTNDPAECYPKVFQPTDDFQIVRDDQDLPSGLHVRLNIQTGQKEAKINVPDEEHPALQGLPVDTSMVIVDPEPGSDDAPRIPANAPGYDPAGKIKIPRSSHGGDEGSAFYRSLSILKKGLDVDGALEMLEDISHDIYYGLKITEDFDTVRELFCLAHTGAIFGPDAGAGAGGNGPVLARARLAALTISSAVQNNPKALAEIEKHWAALEKEKCPGAAEQLGVAAFRLISPSRGEGGKQTTTNNDPALAKARVSAISGLLKNDAIRKQFLAHGGMDLLLEVLVGSEDPEWAPAQRQVGLLVLDNFLDENMGASLGEWPTGEQAKDAECAQRSSVGGDCWDWHAKKLAEKHKSDKNHWSAELFAKLKEQRKANGAKRKGKDEL